MKYLIIIVLSLLVSFASNAQLKTPSLSPLSTVSQKVGLSEMEIKYSRPSVKGRKVFGENGLVPYGEFWRTGANSITKISFSENVTVGEMELKKGNYTILSTLQADTWTVHFYPYEKLSWGKFKTKTPIASVTAKLQKTKSKVETLYIGYENLRLDEADLIFAWEDSRIEIPVKASARDKMLKSIERTMAGPSQSDYFQAALYLHEADLRLDDALKYIQKVTASENAMFFQVYREAVILRDLGRKEEAIAAAERSKVLSEKVKSVDFVRLNERLIKELKK